MNIVIFSHMLKLKFKTNGLKNYMSKIYALVLVARYVGTNSATPWRKEKLESLLQQAISARLEET